MERNVTFEVTDPRIGDEMINDFRQEIKKKGGEVFHVTVQANINAAKLAEWVATLTKGKKIKIDQENPSYLIYSYCAIYRMPEPGEKEKTFEKDMRMEFGRDGLKVKKENADKKRWMTCPVCGQRAAWNYWSHCKCGSNKVPPELQKEYDAVWKV